MGVAEPLFLIHHLTDLHIGSLHYAATRRLSIVPKEQGYRNIELYLDHLQHAPDESLPDLVIISGDLTSYASELEMDAAYDALSDMVALISRKRPAWRERRKAPFVVVVPGNHDLDWSQNTHKSRIERYARRAEALYQDGKVLSASYRGEHEVCWDFGDDVNIFIYLLDTTHLGGSQDPVLLDVYNRLSSDFKRISSVGDEEFRVLLEKLEKEARKDPDTSSRAISGP